MIKISTLNIGVIVGIVVCIAAAAVQLQDLHFAFLAALLAFAGYFMGKKIQGAEAQVQWRDGMGMFGISMALLVIGATMLALGPDVVDRTRWIFIGLAASVGIRIKAMQR